MNTRLLALSLLLICAGAASYGAVTQLPKMKMVPYEGWGIQITVPETSTHVALPAKEDVELWDMHVHGDFVYFVKVMKVSANTLTSTAIEQDIQAESNVATKRGATKRWEMESRAGELFKGLNYYTKPDEDIPEAASELQKVLRGRTGYVSAAWSPLKDDSGPMLVLGVIGPKGRDGEIENLAKFFARGVMIKPKLGAAELPNAMPPPAPAPPDGEDKPQPAVPRQFPKPIAPKRVVPKAAKTLPALKKGDIEIVGVVETIALDKKLLTMTAQEITLPVVGHVQLQPARRKVIMLRKLPAGTAIGQRIVVIGKNTGAGKPMNADVLSKAP